MIQAAVVAHLGTIVDEGDVRYEVNIFNGFKFEGQTRMTCTSEAKVNGSKYDMPM
jgi:hypothetical protein